jgi:hypothetical protein
LLPLALALSAIAHVVAYWGVPDFISVWRTPEAARFEAVLVTQEKSPPPVIAAEPPAKAAAPKPASPRTPVKPRVRVAIAPTPVPFVGPENAIAVDSAPASNEDGKVATTSIPDAAPTPPVTAAPEVPPEKTPEPVVVATATPTAREEPTVAKAIEFPDRIRIGYKMTSNVANGIASMSWRRDGTKYEIDTTIQPTGIFTSMFVGIFRQTSRGEVTAEGVRPGFFSLQRGEGRTDTAEFLRESKELKIIKHGETHLSPLQDRMQDTQSFLFQMAHDMAQGDGNTTSVTVKVTNARKIYEYKFNRIGEETIETRMGPLATIHLKSEAADPEDVYEVWLAPEHHFMPVKLKFFMGRFPVEQVVSSLSSSGKN